MNISRFPLGNSQKTEYKIISQKLPKAFDGFKIAHISDLHSCPAEGAFEIIAGEKPDITVITGDLLQDDEKPAPCVESLIKSILKISPVYFISGNHDEWRKNKEIYKKLADMGAKYLKNEAVVLERDGEKVALFGASDPQAKRPQEILRNLEKSFAALPDFDGYKILLFHRANLFDEIKDRGYDLILSGHMHGGQIRLPRLGGVLAPSSALFSGKRMLFPKYCSGEVIFKNTTMIINRGLGNTLPIPRWGNSPEVGIIKIYAK